MRGTGGWSARTPAILIPMGHRVASLWLLAALAGCGATPKATDGGQAVAPQPAANAKGLQAREPGDGGPSVEQAEAWAAQIEQQTDAFRELQAQRRALQSGRHAATVHAADPVGTPRQTRRRPIEWNGDVNPPDAIAPLPASPNAGAPAVARDQPETIEITPPPSMPTVDDMKRKLLNLRRDLYRESIDSAQPIRELLGIAAMSIVDPDLALPDDAHRDLTRAELEVLEELHQFFAHVGRSLNDESESRETILAALADLQRSLANQPELELPTATLCWRVGGFGDFDEFEPYAFLAHEAQPVILYLEVDGFSSEQNRKSEWVTVLAQQLEIYSDRDGIPVWSDPWQKVSDLTNKRRRDFFTTQMITLPAALSVGKYHLKIRVRDDKSGAESERSIPFEMVADPRLAATVGK